MIETHRWEFADIILRRQAKQSARSMFALVPWRQSAFPLLCVAFGGCTAKKQSGQRSLAAASESLKQGSSNGSGSLGIAAVAATVGVQQPRSDSCLICRLSLSCSCSDAVNLISRLLSRF